LNEFNDGFCSNWFELKGIRYIVLDTRSKDYSANGQIGLIQLGWLYNQLLDSLRQKYCVVVFAHHSPGMMEKSKWTGSIMDKSTTDIYQRMLERFPNIIAYFYGHKHWNEDSVWPDKKGRICLIQTGSLADFPQVGRKVWIYAKANENNTYEAVISWEFVRPEGNNSLQGEILESLLSTSQKESLKEFNEGQQTFEAKWHRMEDGWGLWNEVPLLWKEVDTDWDEWCHHNLGYGEARVTFSLNEPVKPSNPPFYKHLFSSKDKGISVDDIFESKLRIKWTNEMREYMGCPGIYESFADIKPIEKPTFVSPSGIGVLNKLDGERVVIVADDDITDALYRAILPTNISITMPLSLNWDKVQMQARLEDIEAISPWDNRQIFVSCSLSRSDRTGMMAPDRTRLALIEFDENISRINDTFVTSDGFRESIIQHLETSLSPYLQNIFSLEKDRPSHGGLNIEGIVKWDDMLLIGLRDPLTTDGHSIVIPLLNPIQTVKGESDPLFGPPLILNTGPAGFDYKLVEWQPPGKDVIYAALREDGHPIFVDLCENTKSFTDFKLKGIPGSSVPEGISASGDGSGFIIVRDPETFEPDDEVIFYAISDDLIK